MKTPVIARKYLPLQIPVFPTLTIWLVLDRLQVSGVAQAIIWTLWSVIFLIMIIACFNTEPKHPRDIP